MASIASAARLLNPGFRQLLPFRPCLPDLLNLRTAQTTRHFTSSTLLRAVRQQATAPRKTINPAPAKTTKADASARTSYAFVKSLAGKTTPTTLYEGPSHFWFYFGCWSSGITILSWTALTGPSLIANPGELPTWITVTYAASYVILCAMGFYLISRTHNLVSLIRVLPAQATAAKGTPNALQMEVTVKSMVPFIKPRVIVTDAANATLRSRFSLPEDLVPALRRQALEKEKEAQKEQHKFDMNHLMTMPFRKIGRAFRAMFNGVRGAWTDMGFGKMKIEGKEYKVDVTNGFAHDGFRTLEKLVPVE
ncbi:hypothetical protein NLU13_2826 [Sarocladium strictum]|uniref:Uncharacterized protein n=1 Tax=Sarocladium strictum TaxID=5046 RepID=A0AA39L966_SARSR|nr:hypothetical protein NLU13_2826 [Sarocladium strictum]